MTKGKVHLLDYVAGNIRSLVNAIEKCGWEVEWIRKPEDVEKAEVGEVPVNLLVNPTLCDGQCSMFVSRLFSIIRRYSKWRM